jgi:tetratricopeptide (TPR) repeat protein
MERKNWETRKTELEDRLKNLEGEVAMLRKNGSNPDEYKKLVAENTRLKDELDTARKQVETLKVSGEKKDTEIASLKAQINTIQADLTKLRQENTSYQSQVADLTVKLKEMTTALKSGKVGSTQDAQLVEENIMLRGIIMRELRHQERQRQAKELVIAEMNKMENASRQLMDNLEEMTSVRIRISAPEEMLFSEPELKEIQAASGVRATLTADSGKADGTTKKGDAPAKSSEVAAKVDDPKAAEKAFQDTLRKQPKNVEALLGLGALKLQQKKYDDARVLLQKSLVIEPDNDVANYRLGVCYFHQEKMNEALASFEKSVKKNAENARAHHYLGIITSGLGNRHRAESEFKQALAVDPNYADAHFNLAVLYATNTPPDWDQARKHYQDALDRGVKPDDSMEKLLKKSTEPAPPDEPKKEKVSTAAN